MKAKEKLEIKNILQYKDSLNDTFDKINNEDGNEWLTFYPNYDPEKDQTAIFISTPIPIPSCVVNRLYTKKNTDIPLFEYKISTRGTINKNVKQFQSFIFDGDIFEFSFYGAVHDLTIFEDKKDKKYDTFQVTFDSMYSLFDILKQQRYDDFAYRKYWLYENIDDITKGINSYNEKIYSYYKTSEEIRYRSKNASDKPIYFKGLNKECTIEDAKRENYILKKEMKEDRKNILYPKFLNFHDLVNAIESGNKIKIVSYFKSENETYFYYYK